MGISGELLGTIPAWITSAGVLTLLGLVLRYRLASRKLAMEAAEQTTETEQANFATILSEMRKQRDEAWHRVEACEKSIQQLEIEITGLRMARDLDPFPNWIVGATDLAYLFVNREFERHFLLPDGKSYRDIIGKRHEDFWPQDFCRTLYALDAAAKSRPDGTARATTSLVVPRLGESRVTVHKFPVRAQPSGAIIGYAGYITDIEPAERRVG